MFFIAKAGVIIMEERIKNWEKSKIMNEINEFCKSCGAKTHNGDLLCEECKEHFRKIDEEERNYERC